MKEFLKKLGITKQGKEMSNGDYQVMLDTYDEFSDIYISLDKSKYVDKDSNHSTFNIDESNIVFISDNYDIVLNANLDDDVYMITVKEPSEEVENSDEDDN